MVIYGDVLAAVNFLVDLLLLRLTRRLTGIPFRGKRQYLGALTGALCSFSIFLPVHGWWMELLVRAGSALLVVLAAYGRMSWRVFGKVVAVFFAVSFLLAGGVMGLWLLFPSDRIAFANGAFYWDVPPLLLAGCVTAAYLFVCLFDRLFGREVSEGELWKVEVTRAGRTISFTALRDTGCSLREPFSGQPVLVADWERIHPLLTPAEEQVILEGKAESCPGLRPVFFRNVGGGGMLCAFHPQRLIFSRGERIQKGDGWVAVSLHPVGGGGFQGVFPPEMVRFQGADNGICIGEGLGT